MYLCVIQSDSGEVVDVDTLEYRSLDLTRVNHLLVLLSHQKRLLEQVH